MYWIPLDSVKDYLFHEHHIWAVHKCVNLMD